MHTILLSNIAVHVNCTQATLVQLTKFFQVPVFHSRFIVHPPFNRQIAKLLSGNEVRGKVAIGAVQMTVNFIRSLSSWLRKIFSAQFSPDLGRFQRSRTICRASASSRRIFLEEEGRSVDRNDGAWPARGKPLIEWPVLICCAVVRSSKSVGFFLFLIYQRNYSKTLRRKGPGRYHSCVELPVQGAAGISVRPTSLKIISAASSP